MISGQTKISLNQNVDDHKWESNAAIKFNVVNRLYGNFSTVSFVHQVYIDLRRYIDHRAFKRIEM